MGRRVDGSLGALLQGVSQQPVRQRLEGQVTEQTNMTADVVRMLHRRPPTQFLNKFNIGAIDINTTAVHYLELSSGASYYLVIPPNATVAGDITMLDADTGIENTSLTVSANFLNYVGTADPNTDLRMVTVGDVTFVVNTTTTAVLQSDTSDPLVPATRYLRDSARVDIDVGQFSRHYEVTVVVSGTAYTIDHSTPSSTASGAEADIAVDNIADELVILMLAEPGFNDNFNISAKGSSIILWPKTTNLDYSISGHDGIGGGAMKISSKNTVASFTKLPTRAAHDTVYTITGSNGGVDDVYMRFDAKDPTSDTPDVYFQEGTWIETLAPDSKYIIDPATMPHLVAFTGTGTDFELGSGGEVLDFAWANKTVGDSETDQTPGFIDNTISDITTFQDRLVVLTG